MTAYELGVRLGGSEMGIRARRPTAVWSPDMFRDDDDQVAFIIPPLLEDYTLDEDVKE